MTAQPFHTYEEMAHLFVSRVKPLRLNVRRKLSPQTCTIFPCSTGTILVISLKPEFDKRRDVEMEEEQMTADADLALIFWGAKKMRSSVYRT